MKKSKRNRLRLAGLPDGTEKPSLFEVCKAEACKFGIQLTRSYACKGNGGEHWRFIEIGEGKKCVLNYWPSTLRGHIPRRPGSFFAGDEMSAVQIARSGVVPVQPSQSEQQLRRNKHRRTTPPSPPKEQLPKLKTKHKRRKGRRTNTHQPKRSYRSYIMSRAWYARRRQLFRNRGEVCERCGGKEDIQVHHRNYKRVGRERDADLEVLCRGCHENEHEGDKPHIMDPMTREFVERFRV